MIDFSSNGIQVRILKEGFILMNLFLRKFLRLKDKYTRRYVCNLIFPYKADYFNSYWDEIISLGYNCEVNARLEDAFFAIITIIFYSPHPMSIIESYF